jgi:glycerol-3-phosphate acyltransferase PlsY
MIPIPELFGVLLVGSYLVGAVSFAALFAWIKGVDLRSIGSGNYGATNVYRAMGWLAAVGVLLLDAAKGAAMVALSQYVFQSIIVDVLIGYAAIIGHMFSLYLGFKGGKGVATTAGVFAVLAPVPFGITAAVVVGVIVITRRVSVGSLVGCVVMPLSMVYIGIAPVIVWAALPICVAVIVKHRSNIYRLITRTEPPLT